MMQTRTVSSQRVRPPRWSTHQPQQLSARAALHHFIELQQTYLLKFRKYVAQRRYADLHTEHFDWWMFPIDDGSKPEFNLQSDADVGKLRANTLWYSGYREAIKLCAMAWGWDIDRKCWNGLRGAQWTGWDIRLAKMIRSLWLFEDYAYFDSLQQFARNVNAHLYNHSGFHHNGCDLGEILHMTLPRRASK